MLNEKIPICLSCRFFRLEDVLSGLCRVDRSLKQYPMKLKDDSCAQWQECGQQYYIRTGWIKSQLAKEEQGTAPLD